LSCFVGARVYLLFSTAYNACIKHVHEQTINAIKQKTKEAYERLFDESIEY